MTAPFDTFRKLLCDSDGESEKLKKLLQSYGQSDGLTPFRKDAGDDGDDSEEKVEEDEPTAASEQHLVSVLADLLVEGGAAPHRKAALHHLFYHPRGAELVRRLSKKQKETQAMTYNRAEELSAIAKQAGGLEAICKHVISGSSSISEHELVKLIGDNVERRSGETSEQAFARAFSADVLLRKAVQAAKGFSTAGPPREAAASGSAYDQLNAKASEYRKTHPELTQEQAFSKVFVDPSNRGLAAEERRQNRPA
jgi:hypothetical protein